MNLLPSIIAYCDARIIDLRQQEPLNVGAVRELNAVKTLAEGLNQQVETLENMITPKNLLTQKTDEKH